MWGERPPRQDISGTGNGAWLRPGSQIPNGFGEGHLALGASAE